MYVYIQYCSLVLPPPQCLHGCKPWWQSLDSLVMPQMTGTLGKRVFLVFTWGVGGGGGETYQRSILKHR